MTKNTIGQLRERVTVEMEGECVDDGAGNCVPVGWVTIADAWARIQPLKGSETVIAARLTGVQPVVIHVRWTPELSAITPAYRVVHTDTERVYNIKAAANMDEKREYIEILAEAEI